MFSTYFELNPNDLISSLRISNFDNVKEINSYFQSDKFSGFVLKLDLIKYDLIYEAYFVPTKNKDLIELNSNFNATVSQVLLNKKDLLLKSLVKLEVSSDYDAKERRFNNYGSILDLNSNPSLLILLDPINESIKFKISWINPNGKIFLIYSFIKINK